MPTLIYFLICQITLLETKKRKKKKTYNDNRKENEVKYH